MNVGMVAAAALTSLSRPGRLVPKPATRPVTAVLPGSVICDPVALPDLALLGRIEVHPDVQLVGGGAQQPEHPAGRPAEPGR